MLTDKVVAGYTDLPFVVNVTNTVPVLQQNKSTIITNPFIPNEQKEFEIQMLNKEANEILEKEYEKNQMTSIKNQSLQEILQNISKSVTGILDDLFKQKNKNFLEHLFTIFTKDNRYAYIGVLLIMIVCVYMLLTNTFKSIKDKPKQ